MDRDERRDRDERDIDRDRAAESRQDGDSNEDGELSAGERAHERDRDLGTNPPRTTTGNMTAPKFGSATSGGGEFEPGPERD